MKVDRKQTEVTYTLTLSSREAEMLRRLAGSLTRPEIETILNKLEFASKEYIDSMWDFVGALYQGLDYED